METMLEKVYVDIPTSDLKFFKELVKKWDGKYMSENPFWINTLKLAPRTWI
jgi:hypothetical protein